MREPGAAIGREIATGERADAQIDAFISRRYEQRRKSEPERELEAAWVEAEKRQEARRRAQNRKAWREYHRDQAARLRRNLEGLITHHEAQARKLLGDPPAKGA